MIKQFQSYLVGKKAEKTTRGCEKKIKGKIDKSIEQ
jgi:hypothetical protein